MIIDGAVVVPMGKKPGATDECHPVSVGDAFRCAVWSWAAKNVNSQMLAHTWPLAIGSGARGAAALEVVSCRELLALHPDWAVVSDDVKNCHSELPRSKVAVALDKVPVARDLIPGVTADLLPAQRMYLRKPCGTLECLAERDGQTQIDMEDGLQQGFPMSGLLCSLQLLSHTKAANDILVPLGGRSRGYQDDHRHVGPMD